MEKLKILSSLVALALLAGCTSMVKYPPFGEWTVTTEELGPVTANSGKWPLSLKTPPPEYTYYSALRSVARGMYGVPENEIVLGEVDVKFSSEIDGTIRSWTATAKAGRNRSVPVLPQQADNK